MTGLGAGRAGSGRTVTPRTELDGARSVARLLSGRAAAMMAASGGDMEPQPPPPPPPPPPSQPPYQGQPVQTTTWFQRNKGWAIPVGCIVIVMVLTCCGLIGAALAGGGKALSFFSDELKRGQELQA